MRNPNTRLQLLFFVGLLAMAAVFLGGAYLAKRGHFAFLSPPIAGDEHTHAEEDAEHSEQAEEASLDDLDHEHAEETSLELSAEALANLGLDEETIRPVETATFVRTVEVPAIVTERPGRTQLPVSTPMTGIITHVHAVTGEAVTPGTLLFQIRLTHEDLVNSQTEFLKSLGDLDVELKEIARLEEVSRSGALPGKVLLEREYSRDKILASLVSQREALRLHGLSADQIERIEKERRLLTELRIFVPTLDDHGHDMQDELQLSERGVIRQTTFVIKTNEGQADKSAAPQPTLVVQSLKIHKGDSVSTGEQLCVLADYGELYIEGQAFETDGAAIAAAKNRGWKATAVIENEGAESGIRNLDIAYLANEVDPTSRTLAFFVSLQNEILSDERNDRDQRFVTWRYRPGQRMQLRVPVEEWTDQLVLPAAAVVKEGPDSFVFQQNGAHFDRVAIHERYRDRTSVVVANDGIIAPGNVIAMTGAHQMQLALKNKAGGGVDPHAGHSH
jgi:membrane fusion protein, heavy metal efflux system